MPFRLSNEGEKWFKDISKSTKNGFQTDFDAYYFCFIAGITGGKKKSLPPSETRELVEYFPDRFRTRGKLIVALFLCRELIELGVQFKEKKAVHSAISQLINPESQSFLSDEGMREFNKYANGGYEVLTEWFADRPRSLDTFLEIFKAKLDKELSKVNNSWVKGITV
ncbi:MAG: hypothetical protein JXQ25_06110 [Deltaproteobacteria bacterium]|nr:hypothetical protein [Deltaproteobacteria bacterium]